jgi:hypothetical protein
MKKKHGLGLIPTLIICGLAYAAYHLFRTAELDCEIAKFTAKETDAVS